MKTSILKVLGLGVIAGMMFYSCGSSKKITPKNDGEVEIVSYCSGPEYQSNNKAFRYTGIGESMNQMTAKNMAMSQARAGLAATINTTIKTVTDNYVKSGNFNNKEELLNNYEGMTREVVNQTLSGAIVVCEKMTKTQQGNYKSYICLEYGSSEVLQNINNRATSQEILKVDYNYEKFKSTFEEEMSKF